MFMEAPFLSDVLRNAVAEGPVLLLHFHQVDEHVLDSNIELGIQALGDAFVEGLLALHTAALGERDLNDDDPVAPPNAEIAGVVDERALIVLGDDLKAVVPRHGYGLDHGLIDDRSGSFAEIGPPSFHECDAYQGR